MDKQRLLQNLDLTGRPPREAQVKVLSEIADAWDKWQVFTAVAPTGCHGKNQMILMFDGSMKPAKDVVVGDRLMGPDGTVRNVLKLHTGEEEMYKFSAPRFGAMTFTRNHTLSLYITPAEKGQPPRYDEISVEEYLQKSKTYKHRAYLYAVGYEKPSISLPIPPYVLGIWLGDGTGGVRYEYSTTELNYSLTDNEPYVLAAWADYIESNGDTPVWKSSKGCQAIAEKKPTGGYGRSNTFESFFRLGVTSRTKHIPEAYFQTSRQDRLDLLAGLLDTDGHLSGTIYDYVSVSETLALGVQRLSRSLGFTCTYSKQWKRATNSDHAGDWYFRLSIRGTLQDVPVKRANLRYVAAEHQEKNKSLSHFTIESLGPQPYYGFTVDCDHLYVLGNGVVTHNSGKSLLSRAIQVEEHAAIVCSNNQLVNQYASFYGNNVNPVYGIEHYPTRASYEEAWIKSLDPENHSIYNPVSFMLAARRKDWRRPSVIVLDESQSIGGLLSEVITDVWSLNKKKVRGAYGDLEQESKFRQFLLTQLAECRAELSCLTEGSWKTRGRLERKEEKLLLILDTLAKHPEKLAIYLSSRPNKRGFPSHKLHAKPITLPDNLLERFFGQSKVIMLSATLFPPDVYELSGGRPAYRVEVESPIHRKRRGIFYHPLKQSQNYNDLTTTGGYDAQAKELQEILEKIPLRPAIVHCTYSNAIELSKRLDIPHLSHVQSNKSVVLSQWMNEGGILLASGMSEGLDLKDDFCRLNIVLRLQYPNISDKFVEKRRCLSDGEFWYNLQTLKQVVQAAGRGTRNENDFSVTMICDSRFSMLFSRLDNVIPQFFKESLVWRDRTLDEIAAYAKRFIS